MALARIGGVAIRGLVSCVPSGSEGVEDLARRFGDDQARRIAQATGIRRRHLAGPGQCTSDLGHAAATRLMRALDWDPETVDALIVVTQTADHPLPAAACLLQDRLGLPRTCAAFDLNLGCSGFVYGLWAAGGLVGTLVTPGGRPTRALLIAGDTTSRLLDPDDRGVAPLFGDAASACALEADDSAAQMVVHLGTDGAGAPYLCATAGGRRERPGRPLSMDGTQVFVFTLREVPGAIAATLDAAGWTVGDVDRFVLHQANEMMIRRLGHKIGAPDDRLLVALAERGNTSSASIPLAITDMLGDELRAGTRRLLLSGFGVGWSWATAACELGPLSVCETMTADPD